MTAKTPEPLTDAKELLKIWEANRSHTRDWPPSDEDYAVLEKLIATTIDALNQRFRIEGQAALEFEGNVNAMKAVLKEIKSATRKYIDANPTFHEHACGGCGMCWINYTVEAALTGNEESDGA